MFLLAILGVDPAQTLAKYKRCFFVLVQLTNTDIEACQLCNSCIVREYKTEDQDVQGQEPSNINLSLFLNFFDIYRA